MISLKRLVEQEGSEGQYYDLGLDFANFRRAIDGTFEQVKVKFENAIGSKLNGKRIRARASRGYKQYVKDYEFDVSKITLDDYYDNYVIVAHDNTSSKPKEYFLNPGFKIQILGQATGQPSPQKGVNPNDIKQAKSAPQDSPMHVPNIPNQSNITTSSPQNSQNPHEVREDTEKSDDNSSVYDAYSIEQIIKDIKYWFPYLVNDKRLIQNDGIRDFVNGIGWSKPTENGTMSMYDLRLPKKFSKYKLKQEQLNKILSSVNDNFGKGHFVLELNSFYFDDKDEEYKIRIKKISK